MVIAYQPPYAETGATNRDCLSGWATAAPKQAAARVLSMALALNTARMGTEGQTQIAVWDQIACRSWTASPVVIAHPESIVVLMATESRWKKGLWD